MPRYSAADPALVLVANLREQVEGWDDPGRVQILAALARLKDQLEAVQAREQDELRRAASGIGAKPRFSRLR